MPQSRARPNGESSWGGRWSVPSNSVANTFEDRRLARDLVEQAHQVCQSLVAHGRDGAVAVAALPIEGEGALLGGIRLEHPLETTPLAHFAEQCEQNVDHRTEQ